MSALTSRLQTEWNKKKTQKYSEFTTRLLTRPHIQLLAFLLLLVDFANASLTSLFVHQLHPHEHPDVGLFQWLIVGAVYVGYVFLVIVRVGRQFHIDHYFHQKSVCDPKKAAQEALLATSLLFKVLTACPLYRFVAYCRDKAACEAYRRKERKIREQERKLYEAVHREARRRRQRRHRDEHERHWDAVAQLEAARRGQTAEQRAEANRPEHEGDPFDDDEFCQQFVRRFVRKLNAKPAPQMNAIIARLLEEQRQQPDDDEEEEEEDEKDVERRLSLQRAQLERYNAIRANRNNLANLLAQPPSTSLPLPVGPLPLPSAIRTCAVDSDDENIHELLYFPPDRFDHPPPLRSSDHSSARRKSEHLPLV
ncbi:hypothetical protein M3Y99_00454600 [Aphelenchoides fujianensis]|nr:hypothetical protein M3Y99_00454600 [Aphelenchoides fujianensis]